MFLLSVCLPVLLFLPSAVIYVRAEEANCEAYQCNTTTLTNLTRKSDDDEESLSISDASDSQENFHLHSSFSLYCCFHSKPYCPIIRWFKDGKELSNKPGITLQEGGRTLTVFRSAPDDAGQYTCSATSPYDSQPVSHSIEVKLELKCRRKPHLESSPISNPVKVKIMETSPKLSCKLFCFGQRYQLTEVAWRNGENQLILRTNRNYNQSLSKGLSINKPHLEADLTVLNFTKSENISCIFRLFSFNWTERRTFQLIPKDCDEDPQIFAKGAQEVLVEMGANHTLNCQIFCLKNSRFNEPLWRNGNGEVIANSSSKYVVRRRVIDTRNLIFGRPNYEMSLTVINISASETFSCHLSARDNSNRATSFHLVLAQANAPSRSEKSFLEEKGYWIVIVVVVVILVLAVVAIVWFRRSSIERWKIFYRPNKEEEAAQYDAFVSYSENDGGSFVRSTLVPMLEEECGYTLALHYREFIPGASIFDNITDCIHNSRRVVAVVSTSFLESEWCKFEVNQGLLRAIGEPNTLVLIMLNEIPVKDLPRSLRTIVNKVTFLSWDGNQREKMCEKLKRALGSPLTIKGQEDPASSYEESNVDKSNVEDVIIASS